ncbi:MAG: cell division ATP-binding protein FtsE [Oscillospiraceae bacterium]|nr:cell division ATP-binding protein FtsE [Oscillospiraceae bacterium]
MIEFRNVSKDYPSGTHALNNISLKVQNGEFVFIVGSSGAGKSTFLKLIMGEEHLSEGEINVDGIRMSKLKRKKIPYLRRKMGIVFQDFRLIEKMTVYDNVAFAMRCVGASNKTIKTRVPYILKLVGLGSKIKSKPSQLSGGEQQRVALARALVNNPEIIIADEPTGNVDPEMSHEIIDLLSEINKQGTTILIVTHEHELVKEFGKRVIEIHKGKIVHDTKFEDKPAEEIELISSYDQTIPDDELSPLLKLDQVTPDDVQELVTDTTADSDENEEDAPRSEAEQRQEKIEKLLQEIESDDKEELINTVRLDSAKLREMMEEEQEKRKSDADVDSVIDSLK